MNALDAFLKKALIEEIAIKYQNAGMKFQQSRVHAETFVNGLIAQFMKESLCNHDWTKELNGPTWSAAQCGKCGALK